MKTIKKRLGLLFVTSVLGLSTTAIFLLKDLIVQKIHVGLGLALAILITATLLVFLLREYGRYRTAALILENKIMHISAAQIEKSGLSENDTPVYAHGIEVFISCFGVLLDSNVIKFNIDKVRLIDIQIGHEFISLSYGKNKSIRKIQILHGNIDPRELQGFIDRFRYETGIVPVVSDS